MPFQCYVLPFDMFRSLACIVVVTHYFAPVACLLTFLNFVEPRFVDTLCAHRVDLGTVGWAPAYGAVWVSGCMLSRITIPYESTCVQVRSVRATARV